MGVSSLMIDSFSGDWWNVTNSSHTNSVNPNILLQRIGPRR